MNGVLHPRLSVSQASSSAWSLDEDLAFYEEAGIGAVSLLVRKLDAAGTNAETLAKKLADAGIRVTSLATPGPFRLDEHERWDEQRDEMGRIMDIALVLRPDVVVFTTGPAGTLPWERGADAFDEIIQGTVNEAEREGVRLAIEHAPSVRTDVTFVHTVRDAIELGWRVGTGVCLDISTCWAERNIAGTLTAAIDAIKIVRVSDHALVTTQIPDDLVPGDGDVPLARIMGQLLGAGYEGLFDINLVGPRIDEEGYATAIRRSITAVTEIVEELTKPPVDPDADADADPDTETKPGADSDPDADPRAMV